MKKLIIIGTGMTMATILAGCQEPTITYEGKKMPASETEERIEDQLEVENPQFDLEIHITEETEE